MKMEVKTLHEGEGVQIIGFKKVPSKDGSKTYTTYYAIAPWTEYELSREDYLLSGSPVQEFQTTKEFGIQVGDVVEFYYDRAIGNYQPIKDFKMISCWADEHKTIK